MTMDSLNMQVVLTAHGDIWCVSPASFHRSTFLGDGIVTATEGEFWKVTQQLITLIFARAQVFELSKLECLVRCMLALIPIDGSTVDVQPPLKSSILTARLKSSSAVLQTVSTLNPAGLQINSCQACSMMLFAGSGYGQCSENSVIFLHQAYQTRIG